MTRTFITLLVAREACPLYVTSLQQSGRRVRLDEKDRLGPIQLGPPAQRHPVKQMTSQIKVRGACDNKVQPIIQIASAGWKF